MRFALRLKDRPKIILFGRRGCFGISGVILSEVEGAFAGSAHRRKSRRCPCSVCISSSSHVCECAQLPSPSPCTMPLACICKFWTQSSGPERLISSKDLDLLRFVHSSKLGTGSRTCARASHTSRSHGWFNASVMLMRCFGLLFSIRRTRSLASSEMFFHRFWVRSGSACLT